MGTDVKQMGHVHCWHDTGIGLASNPSQTEQVCCHCGEKQYIYKACWVDGHGDYHPQRFGSGGWTNVWNTHSYDTDQT